MAESYVAEYLKRRLDRQETYFIEGLILAQEKYPFLKSDTETPESFRSRVRSSPRCTGRDQDSHSAQGLDQSEVQDSDPAIKFPVGGNIACPFVDTPVQHIHAGLSLYRQLFPNELRTVDVNLPPDEQKKLLDDILKLLVDNMDPFAFSPQSARCFAADFMRAKLDAFDRSVPPHERIDEFMNLEVTGEEVRNCQLVFLRSGTLRLMSLHII